MNLWLPFKLESINHYYIHSHGRMIIGEKGRKQKEYIHKLFADNKLVKIEGPIQLYIVCYYRDNRVRDIDNVLKGLLDSLKDVYFGDDSLVRRIMIEKVHGTHDCVNIQIQAF